MTTAELISYIKKQISNNVPKDLIISRLINAGWHIEDINEGFSIVLADEKSNQETKRETKTIQPVKKEESKVWVPHNLPILEKKSTTIEEQELELPEGNKVESTPINKNSQNVFNEISKNENKELIPTLMPKITINSFGGVNKENFGKKEEPSVSVEPTKNYSIKDLPKVAMLSSYKKDISSFKKIDEENIGKKSRKVSKWLLIIFVLALILAGGAWAYSAGYLKLVNINFSFIKKDPKILILNNSEILSSLSNYKTETDINILFPSVVNISAGLVSGEALPEIDKDSISINTLGSINQTEGNILYDNFVTIKSSLLENYITTNVKSNGINLFISVPDLSQIFKEDAPESTIVKIDEKQFDLIPSLFSGEAESQLKKINLYKIISSGIPSYINNEILKTYNSFINNAEVIEKGQEKIKNIDTYHYSISVDRESTKDLLYLIIANFTSNLPENNLLRLDEILSASNVKSLDVWIGKNDNTVYQYNAVIEIPISKIIGFDDRSIGDNKVVIDWKTTYYDFNISNNIFMPEDTVPALDFINSIKRNKLKNDVISFTKLAQNLFNAEGSYGKTSNNKGSCMNPISGSLFSPVGHNSKGAVEAVSSISKSLNEILKTTNGLGTCFSTTKDWSFSVPISDNYDVTSIPTPTHDLFFCVDSKGDIKELSSSPTGVICK